MSKTIVPNIDDPAQKILLQSMTSTYGRKSKKFMAIRAIINTRSGRSKDIWWAKQYQKVTTFPLIQRWDRRKTRPNCKAGSLKQRWLHPSLLVRLSPSMSTYQKQGALLFGTLHELFRFTQSYIYFLLLFLLP